jgi:hypothetical protein
MTLIGVRKSGNTTPCSSWSRNGSGISAAVASMPERMRETCALIVHGRTTSSALQLREGIRFEEWATLGTQIERISSASAWWMGDWLLYGEHAYGARYQSALAYTRLGYQTLRNYAWVARCFEVSRRRDSLSFGHHAELAAFPEPDQEIWLRRAERLSWTRSQLRRQLAAARRDRSVRDGRASVVLRLQIPPDRERFWRQAASVADQDLIEWIATAADRAAHTLVHPRSVAAANRTAPAQSDARPIPDAMASSV